MLQSARPESDRLWATSGHLSLVSVLFCAQGQFFHMSLPIASFPKCSPWRWNVLCVASFGDNSFTELLFLASLHSYSLWAPPSAQPVELARTSITRSCWPQEHAAAWLTWTCHGMRSLKPSQTWKDALGWHLVLPGWHLVAPGCASSPGRMHQVGTWLAVGCARLLGKKR